jgi:hypothetical protein
MGCVILGVGTYAERIYRGGFFYVPTTLLSATLHGGLFQHGQFFLRLRLLTRWSCVVVVVVVFGGERAIFSGSVYTSYCIYCVFL